MSVDKNGMQLKAEQENSFKYKQDSSQERDYLMGIGMEQDGKVKKQNSDFSTDSSSSSGMDIDNKDDNNIKNGILQEENSQQNMKDNNKNNLTESKDRKLSKHHDSLDKEKRIKSSKDKEKSKGKDKKHKSRHDDRKNYDSRDERKVKHHKSKDKRDKVEKKYKDDRRRSRSKDKGERSKDRRSDHRSRSRRSPPRHRQSSSRQKSRYSRSRSPERSYSHRRSYRSPPAHRSRMSPPPLPYRPRGSGGGGRGGRSPSPVKRRRSPDSPPLGRRGSRSRSPGRSKESDQYGGYQPRKRQEPLKTGPYTSVVAQIKPPTPVNTVQKGKSFQIIQPLHSKKEILTPEQQKIQQEEQMLRARQMILQQQAASAAAAACKTQREFSSQIYVGNLIGGMVSEPALRELLNSCLTAAFPQFNMGAHMLPVVTINMHGDGRYAFVELRSSDMTSAAIQLSGQLQFMGQTLSIGRPSGYIDPEKAKKSAIDAARALALFNATDPTKVQDIHFDQKIMDAMSSQLLEKSDLVTKYICIVGIATGKVLGDDTEYREVLEEIKEECSKYGKVREVIIPKPSIITGTPESTAQAEMLMGKKDYGKVFIKYDTPQEAEAARTAINGRLFDGVPLQVTFVTKDKYYLVDLK